MSLSPLVGIMLFSYLLIVNFFFLISCSFLSFDFNPKAVDFTVMKTSECFHTLFFDVRSSYDERDANITRYCRLAFPACDWVKI